MMLSDGCGRGACGVATAKKYSSIVRAAAGSAAASQPQSSVQRLPQTPVERWNESWGGFGKRWNDAWAAAPGNVHRSMAGIPTQVGRSWERFTDTPQAAGWRQVGEVAEAGVTVAICAYMCFQGGVGTSGWSAGGGLGPDVGVTVSIGGGPNTPDGWSVRGSATGVVGGVGVTGEVGVTNGPTPVAAGSVNFATSVRAGVSGWLSYEQSWR